MAYEISRTNSPWITKTFNHFTNISTSLGSPHNHHSTPCMHEFNFLDPTYVCVCVCVCERERERDHVVFAFLYLAFFTYAFQIHPQDHK
jgi:hypothetical protein